MIKIGIQKDSCPYCNSKNIVDLAKSYRKENGCLCGFAAPEIKPFYCKDCLRIFDNYVFEEYAEPEGCPERNQKCKVYGKVIK